MEPADIHSLASLETLGNLDRLAIFNSIPIFSQVSVLIAGLTRSNNILPIVLVPIFVKYIDMSSWDIVSKKQFFAFLDIVRRNNIFFDTPHLK